MRIEHVALWTYQLERSKDFYTRFFGGAAGAKYRNEAKGFESYFVSFDDGARLELMQIPGIPASADSVEKQFTGFIHVAFEMRDRAEVERVTEEVRRGGFRVLEEPRATGDGYYESTVLDPDGNRIEIASRA